MWLSDVNWLLLGCQQTVHGSRHSLHVNLHVKTKQKTHILHYRHTTVTDRTRVYAQDVTQPYLTNRVGQNVNNLLMRSRHYALAIDLNDAVTNAHTTSLSNPPSHKAANLMARQEDRILQHAE